ncbi:hypothetical protein [Methanohalobium sp.]|uniref:hypothetical protein n=1 Tax=Methanohalobium sp. TaxID=2837493 RepID=UPI0025EC62EB|nr:hypothetical protein [Methanohalobium sp.]
MGLVSTVEAQTDSGEIELTTTASIPSSTSISIDVYEDLAGDGSTDNMVSLSIADGTNTYILDTLEGYTDEGNIYWLDISLSTSDISITPSLDSVEIALPEETTETTTTTTTTEEAPVSIVSPSYLSTQLSILLIVFYGLIGVISMVVNSAPGLLGLSIAIFGFIAVVAFDLSFMWVWFTIAIGIILLLLSIVLGLLYSPQRGISS